MRTLNFAKRNFKEIIRDPLSIIFAVILPLFLYNRKVILKLPCQNFYSMVIGHSEYVFLKIYKLTYHIFLVENRDEKYIKIYNKCLL